MIKEPIYWEIKTISYQSLQKEKTESLKALKASILDRAFSGEL